MTAIAAPHPSGGAPLSVGVYGWYVAAVLSFAHFVSFIDRFLMSLVLAPVKASFDVSDTDLGLLHGTGFVMLYCVAAVPLGRYVDVGNRRNLIIFGILFWSLATVACGLARDFQTLFIARIAVGLGEACLVPAALSMISNIFPARSLGRAVSVFTTGATAGASAALIGGGALLAWLSLQKPMVVPGVGELQAWQSLFVLAGIPGLISVALLLSVREPARVALSGERAEFGGALKHMHRFTKAYSLHIGATCAVIILYQAFAAWTPTFLVRRFSLTVPESGLLVGFLLLLAGPSGNLLGGFVMDRFHIRGRAGAPALTMALALTGAIIPGAIFCIADDLVIAMSAWTVLMTFITMGVPSALAGIQMITPDSHRGMVSALFLAAYTLVGVGLGPILVGLLTDHVFGREADIWLSLLWVVLIVPTVGVVLAILARLPAGVASQTVESEAATGEGG